MAFRASLVSTILRAVLSLALPMLSGGASAVIVGSLSARFDDVLRGGGVVAQGASLSGRDDMIANASASITIAGIPAGATVQRALLYWTISGGLDPTATINAFGVTGTLLGTVGASCWGVNNSMYRADVTSRVTGNGEYTIAGLPSTTVAASADTDGAALIVVYQHLAAPTLRRVMIRDGGISTDGTNDTVTDTFPGVVASAPSNARFHLVVGDAQASVILGALTFNSVSLGADQFNGSDGALWDVSTYNVNVPAGPANISWSSDSGADCLTYQAAVLDFDVPPSADQSVSVDDGVTVAIPGGQVTWTIVAANDGPSDVPSASLIDMFSTQCTSVSTTSVASGGATGNTAGPFAGDINQTLNLPAGSSVTYTSTCNIAANATGSLSNHAELNSTIADPTPGDLAANDTDTLAYTLDIDASGATSRYDALTDGLLAIRHMFGLNGSSLTTNALAQTALRTAPADIANYMTDAGFAFDIDDNGTVDALTDGLMMIRFLFGLTGQQLIVNAIGPMPNRFTADAILTYLNTLTPP